MATNTSASTRSQCLAPPSMKDFVLTQKLGQGSYASVYKGFRRENRREVVAVKCIVKSSLSKSSTENLLKEIEILKAQRHEHIVQLRDFQWSSDHIFLILEYCSGGDLSMYIKKYKRLPEHIARKFLRQLALALQFLHDQRIAHMDLKPHNLLLHSKENPVLKVADFGFAQTINGKQDSSNLRGSPLYMAVEMFLSDSYGAKVDLWSIGVILHETLFGYAPFSSKTNEELELKILSHEPIVIPAIPPISDNCHDLLHRLLQRDPNNRISFENFFSHPFIDLEHAPSADSLKKAIRFATTAVENDSRGHLDRALRHYCASLDYFLPAIDYERDPLRKEGLRKKIRQYIDRAEELKTILNDSQKFQQNHRGSQTDSGSDKRVLALVAPDNALVNAAIVHTRYAEAFDREKKYRHALGQYETAVEIYIKVLAANPGHELRAMVRSEASVLMTRAEELSRYNSVFADDESGKLSGAEGQQASTSRWSKCAVQ